MAFTCGAHRAWIFGLGGVQRLDELTPLASVRWDRQRDDISTAEVTVPTNECCELIGKLRTIEHELHIIRNDHRVWQGPITRIEIERDITRIFAEDVLWQAKRAVIEETYDQSHPNIWPVIDRINWLLQHCYERNNDPWKVLPRCHAIRSSDEARTSRIVFAWQMYVWDDLDKYAEDYGIDYTVYNREIYYWDTHLRWKVIGDLDESHLSQSPRIVEYGNQLATRGVVTNAHGYAGVSAPTVESFLRYHTTIDWLTTNEMDGQPGLIVDDDGNVVPDPAGFRAPTPEEIAGWAETAWRSVVDRYPAPVSIVIPANTVLMPGAPWEMDDLVPGAWFKVTTERMCRQVTEWHRLDEVTVTEEAPAGETVAFTASAAPNTAVTPSGIPPDVPPPEWFRQ